MIDTVPRMNNDAPARISSKSNGLWYHVGSSIAETGQLFLLSKENLGNVVLFEIEDFHFFNRIGQTLH